MAYSLEYSENVTNLLNCDLPMSRTGRVRLYTRINQDLRERGDELRNDPALRVTSNPSRFIYQRVFLDDPDHGGDGKIYHLRIIVDDSAASQSVLKLIYADLLAPPEFDFDAE